MSQNRPKKCCRSIPVCKHCPLRPAPAAAQVDEQREGLATLIEEIFRGSPRTVPDSLADALLSLSLARRERATRRAR